MITPDNLLLILGSGALLLLILAGIVISRSWGNFPTRIQMPPELQAPRPNQPSSSASDTQPSFQGFSSNQSTPSSNQPSFQGFSSNQTPDAPTVYGFGNSAAPSSSDQTSFAPMLITNSLIRQAAEQALRQGAPQARHFMRQNDQIYVTFDAIPDPEQRQKIHGIMTAIQQGNAQNIGLREALLLIRQLV